MVEPSHSDGEAAEMISFQDSQPLVEPPVAVVC